MTEVAVKEYPILFKPEMVRAVLDGRKTVTRRIVKPQPVKDSEWAGGYRWDRGKGRTSSLSGMRHLPCHCPYGDPGDHLYVRESFRTPEEVDHLPPSEIYSPATSRQVRAWCPTRYEADEHEAGAADECHAYGLEWSLNSWRGWGRLRPSIHMPKNVSRIQLEVAGVRVEQIQDITPEDVFAEGLGYTDRNGINHHAGGHPSYAVSAFRKLWDEINADRGFSWESNCWVWIVEFRRIKP